MGGASNVLGAKELSGELHKLIGVVDIHRPQDLLDVPALSLRPVSFPPIALYVISSKVPAKAVEFPCFSMLRPREICLQDEAPIVIEDSMLDHGPFDPVIDEEIYHSATEVRQWNSAVTQAEFEECPQGEATISTSL